MAFFVKISTILAIVFGVAWSIRYGYELTLQQVSIIMEETYGSLGNQLEDTDLSGVAQDLQEVNNRTQGVLNASSTR